MQYSRLALVSSSPNSTRSVHLRHPLTPYYGYCGIRVKTSATSDDAVMGCAECRLLHTHVQATYPEDHVLGLAKNTATRVRGMVNSVRVEVREHVGQWRIEVTSDSIDALDAAYRSLFARYGHCGVCGFGIMFFMPHNPEETWSL